MTEDELILTSILQCPHSDLYLRKPSLTAQQQKQFESYKVRRENGEPLQYLLGCCEFYGLKFKVDQCVLIPRPETEVLVETAIQRVTKAGTGPCVLDLGTGSGNIAIALAKHLAGVRITAMDISQEALDVARDNAVRHGVDGRIEFIQMDMLVSLRTEGEAIFLRDYFVTKGVPRHDTGFDLIISNPPYIPTEQMKTLPADVQKEPRLALEAGEDGLKFHKYIIKYTPFLLRAGGYLMMEFGDGQGQAVKELILQQQVFSNIQILQDLAGKDRIICAQNF
ncbi:MAG: peptide chain release factor N(5)-glutamine methyltransferase [Candidatus Omnitrophica bacterium]|nr:peptide chain release factor N(5)-glutamine methyltransferase [Candidatus Omnitrophota bacterium]